MFEKKKIFYFQKFAGLWLVGKVDNHVAIYGSKVAEGFSAFQRRLVLYGTSLTQDQARFVQHKTSSFIKYVEHLISNWWAKRMYPSLVITAPADGLAPSHHANSSAVTVLTTLYMLWWHFFGYCDGFVHDYTKPDIGKSTGPRPVKTVEDRWKPLLCRSSCPVKKSCREPLYGDFSVEKMIRSCKSFGGPEKLGFSMWLPVLRSGKGPKVFPMSARPFKFQSDLFITQPFSLKYSQRTLHSSPVRARFRVLFVSLWSEWYPTLLIVTPYIILCQGFRQTGVHAFLSHKNIFGTPFYESKGSTTLLCLMSQYERTQIWVNVSHIKDSVVSQGPKMKIFWLKPCRVALDRVLGMFHCTSANVDLPSIRS